MAKKIKAMPANESYMTARRLLRKIEDKLEGKLQDRSLLVRHKEAV